MSHRRLIAALISVTVLSSSTLGQVAHFADQNAKGPTLTNCTFRGNAAEYGGAMCTLAGTATLANCVLWENPTEVGQQIYNDEDSQTFATYICIQGGWLGRGNMNLDPMFVDADGPDDTPCTPDDDLHLLVASPCINAGDNAALPIELTTDLDGEDRIQQCRVDMGAEESPYYFDCNGNGVADACDIETGDSSDEDQDGKPDECQGACCVAGTCVDLSSADQCFACNVATYLPDTFTGCYGDLDGDGVVAVVDRGFVSANIGETDPVLMCLYDVDGNGVISVSDRGFVSANVGGCTALPDFQNGSGLNHGQPDSRFADAVFAGTGTSCADDPCNMSACEAGGGVESTALCCEGVGDYPNTCLIGGCGCAPAFSHEVRVCQCPDEMCFDGVECVRP